jgi:phospholipid-binding lipoprotein MlaA
MAGVASAAAQSAALTPVSLTQVAPVSAPAPEADAAPVQAWHAPGDPWEKVNRRVYKVNRKVDAAMLRPAAMAYEKVTPKPVRKGLRNFLANLGEPMVFINDILQLKIAKGAKTVVRFATNSTFGVGGLMDPATKAGFKHHDNNFGVTLARYGVPPGPYVFVPLLGPSTVRDLVGSGVDLAANPLTFAKFSGVGAFHTSTTLVAGLDERVEADPDLKAIDEMGADTYATMRSLYLQNRRAQITGGEVDIANLPDFDDPGDAAAPEAVQTAAVEPAAPETVESATAEPSMDGPSGATTVSVASASVAVATPAAPPALANVVPASLALATLTPIAP